MQTIYITFIAKESNPAWKTSKLTHTIDEVTAGTCCIALFSTVLSEESYWASQWKNENYNNLERQHILNYKLSYQFTYLSIHLSIYLLVYYLLDSRILSNLEDTRIRTHHLHCYNRCMCRCICRYNFVQRIQVGKLYHLDKYKHY